MANSSKDTAKKTKSFWAGVKAEFSKIIWPNQNQMIKQSIAVLAISIVVGAVIALLDFGIQFAVNFLTSI